MITLRRPSSYNPGNEAADLGGRSPSETRWFLSFVIRLQREKQKTSYKNKHPQTEVSIINT